MTRSPTTPEQPTDPEDTKIITLAKATLARAGSAQAACLRDTDGRTYAGATVALEHLQLSAVQVALAMAVSSGAPGLEAVAVTGGPPSDADLAALGDLPGTDVSVWTTAADGTVLDHGVVP
jgi:hypothetical protein